MENISHQEQIKKLQTDLLDAESQADKGSGIQKSLDEKENVIQLLKKLKIPSTQLIQASELTDFEKEKEDLNGELTDCKAKILKFTEKEKQWQRDMSLVVESEKTLKAKYDELERNMQEKEKEIQEKEKELESRIIPPSTESGEQTILQAMSQVSLKELELVGLKK